MPSCSSCIYFAIVLLCIYSCSDPDKSKSKVKSTYLRHVGDIPFDNKIDDPEFKPCDEELATVHYAFSNPDQYKGEKPAIIKEFAQKSLPYIEGETGYITIRFLVNCRGETGRFRLEQFDKNYIDRNFNANIIKYLLETTKSMNGWLPAIYNDESYDYYKYLTFKIENNDIVKILP